MASWTSTHQPEKVAHRNPRWLREREEEPDSLLARALRVELRRRWNFPEEGPAYNAVLDAIRLVNQGRGSEPVRTDPVCMTANDVVDIFELREHYCHEGVAVAA